MVLSLRGRSGRDNSRLWRPRPPGISSLWALAWFRAEVERAGFPGLELQVVVYRFVDINRDYNLVMEDVVAEWNTLAANYSAPYYPHVSVGWDSSPRAFNFTGGIIKNNTPENFEQALVKARDFADAHPGQAPLITSNSWNEWTETTYLQPCTLYGYGYLEAVRRVFGAA